MARWSLALALSACTFRPSVDDTSLVDCVVDADCPQGDFHLTPASACCIGSGAPPGPGDPVVDYDGVPRDAQAPASGPYEVTP